jgi:hypothetical protein
MSRNLILINSSHYKQNNLYEYKFPNPVDLSGYRLDVKSFSMYNSTFNISYALGNNTFSIKWINNVVFNYTIPDGYYSIDQLNLFLEYCMLGDKLYVKTTTAPVFFFNISDNVVQQTAQISVNYVPNSAEATTLGYQLLSGCNWTWPADPITPTITICSGLQQLLGFKGGIVNNLGYQPAQSVFPITPLSTNEQFTSTSLPILSPTYCIVLTSNLINSNFSNVPTLMCQVPIDVSIGSLIRYESTSNKSVKISNSKFGSILVWLYNQDMSPLQFKDYEITLTLSIEEDTEGQLVDAINKLNKSLT